MSDTALSRELSRERGKVRQLENALTEVHEELHKTNSELMTLTLELDDRVEERTRALKASEEQLREHRDHLQEIVRARTASLELLNQTLEEKLNELEASEERFRTLVATIPDIVYRIDFDGRFTFVNDAIEKLGYEPQELIGVHFSRIIATPNSNTVCREVVLKHPELMDGTEKPFRFFDERRTGKRKTTGLEVQLVFRNRDRLFQGHLEKLSPETVVVEVNSAGLYREETDRKRRHIGTVGVIRDISERKTLEEDLRKARDLLEMKVRQRTAALEKKNRQLAEEIRKRAQVEKELVQAQKMEAIGTLAGGIAHDFNNILSIILGFSELVSDAVSGDEVLAEYMHEVTVAGTRAKDLISQILTFARKTDEAVLPLNVSLIAKEVVKLLRATIPTSIEIIPRIRSEALVLANPTQMHQIFMNLSTNAAHAMKDLDSGILTITVAQWDPETEKTEALNLKARGLPDREMGDIMMIRISDNGKGIAPEHLDHIFQPYFTTKEQGEGTGLGLAVVHGIVKECGGEILIDSEVGQGTTITILLPITISESEGETPAKDDVPTGTEHILIVDDEEMIIRLGARILESLGYRVTAFTGSREALAVFKAEPEAFDLVITDMTMPYMTGDRLAAEIKRIRPDIPVIMQTGYHARINEESAQQSGICLLLIKPVNTAGLARAVRTALDDPLSTSVNQ